MSPHETALNETLEKIEKNYDFKNLCELIKQHGVEFEFINDPDDDPAFFWFNLSEYKQVEDLCLVINTAYSPDEIPLFLIHELIHMDQKLRFIADFKRVQDYNITSQIGYVLLAESHAYAGQNEFLVKDYIQQLNNKAEDKAFSTQNIQNIYKATRQIEEKNDRTQLPEYYTEYDYISYLFNLYLNGLRKDDVYIPTSAKDAKKAIKAFNKNNYELTKWSGFKKAKENIFKGFFDIQKENTRGFTPFANEFIDEYISDLLDEFQEHKNNFGTPIPNEEMPFEVAINTLCIDGKPFLSKKYIQKTLCINNLSDIAKKYIETSSKKEEFQEKIQNITNSMSLNEWRQQKRLVS